MLALLGPHIGLHLTLALRLYAGTQALSPVEAFAHVHAASAAATDEVPVELLLAMAYVESGYDPTWVSRVQDDKRITRRHRSTRPPKRLDRTKSMFCGVLQTHAPSWRACLAQRDLLVAYRTGAAELTSWLRDRRVRGDVSRALAGYGCGNRGVRTGKCNRYPARVLYRARRLKDGHNVRVQARTRS